jgi:hypothetical protein
MGHNHAGMGHQRGWWVEKLETNHNGYIMRYNAIQVNIYIYINNIM